MEKRKSGSSKGPTQGTENSGSTRPGSAGGRGSLSGSAWSSGRGWGPRAAEGRTVSGSPAAAARNGDARLGVLLGLVRLGAAGASTDALRAAMRSVTWAIAGAGARSGGWLASFASTRLTTASRY